MTEKMQSDSVNKEKWRQFINAYETPTDNSVTYTYPVFESKTDNNVEKQDPGKLQREKGLYRKWLNCEWQVAIDFGCGIGANFDCFDQQQCQERLLIGLDPDAARVRLARDNADQLKYVKAVVTCAGVSLLENSPDELVSDAILCSQVLGHVPRKELGRIVRGFADKLRSGGSCAISVPVVGTSFSDDTTAGGWVSGNDFTHLVYCDRTPFEKNYRKRVPYEVFDQYATCSPEGVLPVRNFWVSDFPHVSQQDLPTPIATIPPTIAQAIEPFFEISKSVLYAIHGNLARKTEEVGIGDAFIILTRT
jgi:SAM-dependent methyltransferase